MCGIATISIGRRTRNIIPYESLRNLVTEILVELEVRGNDASGIAILNEPGEAPSPVFKKPLRPSRLVVRPKFKEALSHIGSNTNFILLHARAATVGGTTDNFNNHPIIIPKCVGIHNGTLYNHEQIIYNNDINPLGDVDSEVIFQLYRLQAEDGLESQEAITATIRQLRGSFTGGLVDLDHPHRLVMFKFGRPLALITIPHFDIVLTISEPYFYAKSVERLKLKHKAKCKLVAEGTGIIIDVNIDGRITENIKVFGLPVEDAGIGKVKYNSWVNGYGPTH